MNNMPPKHLMDDVCSCKARNSVRFRVEAQKDKEKMKYKQKYKQKQR